MALSQTRLRAASSWKIPAMAAPRSCRGYIRINALDTEYAFQDLEAVVAPAVDGIVVPKIDINSKTGPIEWLANM